MAHEVTFKIPSRRLDRADVIFEVTSDEAMLGTLMISKGTLVWFPSNTTKGYRIDWDHFDRLMKDHVTGEERR